MHVVTEGVIRVVKDVGGASGRSLDAVPGRSSERCPSSRGDPRIASLVADGEVRTIRIGHGPFESMLRERPELAIGVMRVLADRLAESARS